MDYVVAENLGVPLPAVYTHLYSHRVALDNPRARHVMEALHLLRLGLFGETTLFSLTVDWLPLICVAVAPLTCVPLVLCGLLSVGGEAKSDGFRFGERLVMRRVMLAVRADVRLLTGSGGGSGKALRARARNLMA